MTVTADAEKRVVLPTAQPGDCFDLQVVEQGKLILTRLGPVHSSSTKVTIERRGGFSVGVLDHPVDDDTLAEALRDFP